LKQFSSSSNTKLSLVNFLLLLSKSRHFHQVDRASRFLTVDSVGEEGRTRSLLVSTMGGPKKLGSRKWHPKQKEKEILRVQQADPQTVETKSTEGQTPIEACKGRIEPAQEGHKKPEDSLTPFSYVYHRKGAKKESDKASVPASSSANNEVFYKGLEKYWVRKWLSQADA
jgi:hypothetical protein